ncbi:unnamed protein product [Miscanthus lutarioriparius]|uniref:K Homology domain-containing protein n=1 Tax=Miscanthus lutarioriparius TaxID=422564 RepID=A0A811MKE0_9POAL|nr:unnamed protein product [Miscanthus lutarioriparius]
MDGQVENFVGHDEGGLPQVPYDGEQPNPYDDVAKQYSEELGDQYNEQPEQADLYSEETGNQYNEDPANSYQEELENAFSGDPDMAQQDNSQVNNVDDNKWPGWPGESVFHLLVPAQKVGAIIGRKGEFIKKMCEETKARIKILDGPPGVPERAVMISAKDEPEAPLSPAVDGLLRVHKRITDSSDGESGRPQRSAGNIGPTRLLVPSSQAGSLIGKQGATIKSIQDSSKSVVRIVENVPPVALHDDRVVEIQGKPLGVQKAVELIASHLRKFLVDRSVLPLFETHMKMHGMPREQPVPPLQHWGPQTWGPPPNIPPGIQPPSIAGSQVTHNMHIPLAYADAVIGAAGASINYIRRHSGATVTIQESRGAPGEMTVEIIGTAAQVQTAEQLIQRLLPQAHRQLLTLPLHQLIRAMALTHQATTIWSSSFGGCQASSAAQWWELRWPDIPSQLWLLVFIQVVANRGFVLFSFLKDLSSRRLFPGVMFVSADSASLNSELCMFVFGATHLGNLWTNLKDEGDPMLYGFQTDRNNIMNNSILVRS